MEAKPPEEASATGESAAGGLVQGTMLPGTLADSKAEEGSRPGSLASAPTTDHDPIADDLDEIIRLHHSRLKASQQGAGAAAPAVTRAQHLAKEDEVAGPAKAAQTGRPLSSKSGASLAPPAPAGAAEEVQAAEAGEASPELNETLRQLKEREEALQRREEAMNKKLTTVKLERQKLRDNKKKKGLGDELDALRQSLDQIKVSQMHDMVDTVDATIKEQQVKCKFMYLTNQQTGLIDIAKMPQVSKALGGFQPKMVIRLMPSHFGIEYWNAFKNWSFVRKVNDKDVWDGRFPNKQVPEMSEDESIQTENRLILFVKEVLLPLAIESHALVVGTECCSLVNAFAKVSAPIVRQYRDEAPFRLLIFARSYFFALQAKQEGTVARAVLNKCKQWQRVGREVEKAMAARYGDDDSFWPQPDLLAGEYSLILFECLTDSKLAVESSSHFENDFIQAFSKDLPVIAIQTYGTNKMEFCPTVADHANRGLPLFLLDSRKRSDEDNVYKGAADFATFRDCLRQRLQFRQWHLHNKDGEDEGAVDFYTTTLIAYARDQVNKAIEQRRRGKGQDGGSARPGSGGQAGKDADKGDGSSMHKQKDMWLWEAILDGREETRKLAQQSREQYNSKRDFADDDPEKEMQDLLVQVTNVIMEYHGADIEWESKQLFRRCNEGIADLRTADSWESLRRKLDANWLKLRGYTFHSYGKAKDFIEKNKWCELKNLSQGRPSGTPSGSRKLAIVAKPPTDGDPGVSFSVANVSYQALSADKTLRADFEAAVRDSLALAAGNGTEQRAIDLALSAGSVNVLATFKVSEDRRASVLAQLRSAPALGTNIESRIASLSGISGVASGAVAVEDFRVLEDVEAVRARDKLVQLIETEKWSTHGFVAAVNTVKAFKRRETIWVAVYDLLKSKDVHVGNLHDVSGVRSELFRLAQRDRLPDSNSQEALLLLRRAWVLVDLYMSYARMYKVYAKIFYFISLLLGVAIVVISVVQPALPNDFDEKTAQYTLLGLGLTLSGVTGASTIVDPTTKWLALRGTALAMESEIWKFRTRVGEYRGVSKAGTSLPRMEAERQALQEFHFRIDALQENVQQSSGLKDTGFYAQTTATDDSEDEDEQEQPARRGSALVARVSRAFGSSHSPGGGQQPGGEAEMPREPCCFGLFFCPRRCRCSCRCCPRRQDSVELLADQARDERMKAKANRALTRSKLYEHGQYKSSRRMPAKTQELDNFHSPANMTVYIRFRLVPQMCFYQKRIPRYYRLRRFYQTLLLAASIINAILAAVQEPTWTAIVSSASGAFAAWQEFSSTAKKLERYSTASGNLSNILLWWQALPDVDQADVRNVEALVEYVETLLGGERAAWLSDAQQALKGAKQAKDKEGGEEKKEGSKEAGE